MKVTGVSSSPSPSPSGKAGDQCPGPKTGRKSHFFILFRPSIGWMRPTYTGEGSLIQNTLADMPRSNYDQISGYPIVQSSRYIKFTIPPSCLSSLGTLSMHLLGSVSHFKPQTRGRHSTSSLLSSLIDSSTTAFLVYVPSFQVPWHHPVQTFTLGQLDCQSPLVLVFLPFSLSSSSPFSHWLNFLNLHHLLPARPILRGHILATFPVSGCLSSIHIFSSLCVFPSFPYLCASVYICVIPCSWTAFLLSVHSTPSSNSETASHFCSSRKPPPTRSLPWFYQVGISSLLWTVAIFSFIIEVCRW